MQDLNGMVTFTFILYLLLVLVIGYIAYGRTRNLSDYILGGRQLGPWVTAISACASDMSGWLLLGLPGYAYAAGLEASWIALGLLLGTYANWRLMALRLRQYSEIAGNSQTLPEFLENRFQDNSGVMRVLAAVFILFFYVFYTSSGLVAGGKLFNAVFDLPYFWAVVAGTVVMMVYIYFGGFLAVSWTDLVQGMLMLLALILVPVFLLMDLGGWENTLARIEAINPALLELMTDHEGQALGVLAIISLLAWGLGYFGQPHILARFKAIRDTAALPRARRIAVSWIALSLLGAVGIGFAGISFFQPALQGADTEKVFILLVQALFHPLVAGICLAAILAAIMSTADSQLLVASAAFSNDVYQTLFRKQASDRELVRVSRYTVLVVAAVALWLARDPESQVLDLVAYAWAGFGAAFGPCLILALYWPRMNRFGAYAGILVGGITVVVWKNLSGGVFDLYEIVPGFILAFLACIGVSLLTPPPPVAVTQQFRRVTNALAPSE